MNNSQDSKNYLIAVVIAFFVTFLWSTSFVIIKIGLKSVTPMLFSGFRYLLASVLLFFLTILSKEAYGDLKSITKRELFLLICYGLVFIAMTQGFQYLSLNLLPAITVSQLLTTTPVIVIIMSQIFLKEIPTKIDILLLLTTLFGIFLFYYPFNIPLSEQLGLFFLLLCLFSNASSTIIGRYINSTIRKKTLTITTISMFFGGLLLTVLGLVFEKASFSLIEIFYVILLAVINTALAFTLWNRSMKTLRALDISLINNTMLPQITVLSIVFLGEMINFVEFISLTIILTSIILIQFHSISTQNNKKVEFMI